MKTLISSLVAIVYCAAIAALIYMSAGPALTEQPAPASVVDAQNADVTPS